MHDLTALRRRLTVKLPEKTYTFDEPALSRIASLSEAAAAPVGETPRRLAHELKQIIPGLTATDVEFLLTPRVFEGFLSILMGDATNPQRAAAGGTP